MKKLISYTFIIFTALSVLVACRKGDNPKLKGLTIQVPEPQLTKDPTTDQFITAQDPASFSAKFTVGTYFPSETPPKSMDVVIIKNNDRTQIKMLKAGVTTYPFTMTLTDADLKTLFGAETVLGDSYDIGVNITAADGTYVPAFSAYGGAVSYGSGVTAQGTAGKSNTPYPPATPQITYTAVCKFIMADYGTIGSSYPYDIITDEWSPEIPYAQASPVTVKIISDTQLSFTYGPANAPIVCTINPADNSVSIAKTDIGDYGANLPYGDVSVSASSGAKSFVSPCDLTLSIYPAMTVSAGGFGNYQIQIKKH